MKTELVQFNELKAAIVEFVAPAKQIAVTDFASSQRAIEVAKQIKSYLNQVETTRRALTDPLLAEQKRIKAYADDIKSPLETVGAHIQKQLATFEEEQERLRAEAARRAEEIRRKLEAEAHAKAQKEAEELAARQAAEAQQEAEEPSLFGSEVEEESLEAKHAREAEEFRIQQEQQAAVRAGKAKAALWDIEQNKINGARKNWKCEIENVALIPKEFLIVTLNEKAALAAHKAGVAVPGVKFWAETTIAIGSKTYVPRAALRGEGS